MQSDDVVTIADEQRQEQDEEAGSAPVEEESGFNFRKQVKKQGSGPLPPKNAMARVHYVAWLQDGGTQVLAPKSPWRLLPRE